MAHESTKRWRYPAWGACHQRRKSVVSFILADLSTGQSVFSPSLVSFVLVQRSHSSMNRSTKIMKRLLNTNGGRGGGGGRPACHSALTCPCAFCCRWCEKCRPLTQLTTDKSWLWRAARLLLCPRSSLQHRVLFIEGHHLRLFFILSTHLEISNRFIWYLCCVIFNYLLIRYNTITFKSSNRFGFQALETR